MTCHHFVTCSGLKTPFLAGFVRRPSGIRTLDTLIKSQVLCQLS